MSYSAFFTAGLNLASQPRTSEAQNVPPQALSSAHTRTRRRQSSLSITTSPLAAVKPPLRTAVEAAKAPFKNSAPGAAGFHEPSTSPRARLPRRKTVSNGQDLPVLPAPTSPLPPLPPLPSRFTPSSSVITATSTVSYNSTRKRQNSTTISNENKLSSPIEESPYPSSSPIAVAATAVTATDPVLPPSASATPAFGSLRNNTARRSSSALPPFSVVRGLFTPSAMGNTDGALVEERHS